MNTLERIEKLIDAGFKADDIKEMLNIKSEETPATNEEVEASNERKDEIKEQALNDEIFGKLNASIEAFTKKLENFNVMNAEQEREVKKEGLEDILARVLTPNGKEIK